MLVTTWRKESHTAGGDRQWRCHHGNASLVDQSVKHRATAPRNPSSRGHLRAPEARAHAETPRTRSRQPYSFPSAGKPMGATQRGAGGRRRPIPHRSQRSRTVCGLKRVMRTKVALETLRQWRNPKPGAGSRKGPSQKDPEQAAHRRTAGGP